MKKSILPPETEHTGTTGHSASARALTNYRGPLGVLRLLTLFYISHFFHFSADPYRGPLEILGDLQDGRISAPLKRTALTV
jgi:hypothetical protein